MRAEDKLQELKDAGIKVYSFSKLGSFINCEFEYYNSYILKNRGVENVYTLLGSCIHNNLEDIYSGSGDKSSFKTNYTDKLIELEMSGITFPNDKIGDSYKADVLHFVENFNKLNTKMIQEQLIVFEIADGIWMQGYIDAIIPSEKGNPFVNIIDWKTSSKFSGKKLNEAGRQLLMYKIGLEATTNKKVDKVMWCMVKYINVCSMQKNGKVKKKMCNRGKWVKELTKQLEKDLHTLSIDEFELELLLDKAISDNNLESLPKEIQDKYWLEDCYVEYEITDEKVEEFKKHVVDTVNEIENKDKENEDVWEAVEISKFNSFYCSTLCGHRKTCKHYKKFLEENADGFDKKDKKNEIDFDDLFK